MYAYSARYEGPFSYHHLCIPITQIWRPIRIPSFTYAYSAKYECPFSYHHLCTPIVQTTKVHLFSYHHLCNVQSDMKVHSSSNICVLCKVWRYFRFLYHNHILLTSCIGWQYMWVFFPGATKTLFGTVYHNAQNFVSPLSYCRIYNLSLYFPFLSPNYSLPLSYIQYTPL